MRLITLDTKTFDNFAQSVPRCGFEQTSHMKDLLEKRGYQVEAIGLVDTQNKVYVAAITFSTAIAGGLHMEIHYGPIYQDRTYLTDFLIALKQWAKQKGVIELEIKPYDTYQTFDSDGHPISEKDNELIHLYQQAGYHHAGLTKGFETSDWHYVKNLKNVSSEKLLSTFSKKGKPLVKKAKTFGIQLRALSREELPLFKEIVDATSDRRGYVAKNLDYYLYLYDSFGEDCQFMVAQLNFSEYLTNLKQQQSKLHQIIEKLDADLLLNPNSEKKRNQLREFKSQFDTFTTRQEEAKTFIDKYGEDDIILAGSLFLYNPVESVYLYSGSYIEFNRFYAPALLQEHVMLESLKRHLPTYNLLGIAGDFDGSDGVLRFKQNFNGHIERKPGSFYYYPHPIKYKIIKAVKKILRRS